MSTETQTFPCDATDRLTGKPLTVVRKGRTPGSVIVRPRASRSRTTEVAVPESHVIYDSGPAEEAPHPLDLMVEIEETETVDEARAIRDVAIEQMGDRDTHDDETRFRYAQVADAANLRAARLEREVDPRRAAILTVPAGPYDESILYRNEPTTQEVDLFVVVYADGTIGFAIPAGDVDADHPWRIPGTELRTFCGRGWATSSIASPPVGRDRIALDHGAGWFVHGRGYRTLLETARLAAALELDR